MPITKRESNEASFIYIGTPDAPEKDTFEQFINIFDSRPIYIFPLQDTNKQSYNRSLSLDEINNYHFYFYIEAIKSNPSCFLQVFLVQVRAA